MAVTGAQGARGHVVSPSMFVKQIKHVLERSPALATMPHMAQQERNKAPCIHYHT